MLGWGPFMVVINNGDGNSAGRNAVNLFTQTSHWLWGSMASREAVSWSRDTPHTHIRKHFISTVVQNIRKNMLVNV